MNKYLFIDDFNTLKKDIKNIKYQQYLRLSKLCGLYENMDVPEIHPPKSTTYLGIAIVNLALMYLLSEDERYLNETKRFMLGVCKYEKWGNAHLVNVDLSASWILFGLSLGYDWLKDKLNDEERKIVSEKLALQGKIMADYKINTEGKGWSTNYFQNHNWINLTGLAACGYALQSEYPEAKEYVKLAKENFEIVFSLLANDGSNYEGVVYWRYGGMWLFIYAHLLNNTENIDFFKKSDYLKNTFYYRLYQASSDLKRQLNFGDCHDRYSGHTPCVYYKIAKEYNNGHAQKLGNLVVNNYLYEEQYLSKVKPGIIPEAVFELLWYEPSIIEEDFDNLSKTKYFPDLGLITIRDSFNSNSTVFSFKCGYPGGKKQWEEAFRIKEEKGYDILSLSHHHPDNLSYILTKDDAYLVIDEGYNRNIVPDNHNVLLVDGQTLEVMGVNDPYKKSIEEIISNDPSFNPVKDYYGIIGGYVSENNLTFFLGETSKTYKRSLKMKEVSRFVLTNNLKYIVMIDYLDSELEHTYSTVFNTDVYPKKTSKNSFLYEELFTEMHYHIYSDKISEFKTYEQKVKSVMTTQEPDNYCQTILKTLAYETINKTQKQRFVQIIMLDSAIKNTYYDRYVRIDNEYIFWENDLGFKTDAKYLYVSVIDNLINSIGILDGSYVSYKEKILIEYQEKLDVLRSDINEIFE